VRPGRGDDRRARVFAFALRDQAIAYRVLGFRALPSRSLPASSAWCARRPAKRRDVHARHESVSTAWCSSPPRGASAKWSCGAR
jgi:hypothetical protein